MPWPQSAMQCKIAKPKRSGRSIWLSNSEGWEGGGACLVGFPHPFPRHLRLWLWAPYLAGISEGCPGDGWEGKMGADHGPKLLGARFLSKFTFLIPKTCDEMFFDPLSVAPIGNDLRLAYRFFRSPAAGFACCIIEIGTSPLFCAKAETCPERSLTGYRAALNVFATLLRVDNRA